MHRERVVAGIPLDEQSFRRICGSACIVDLAREGVRNYALDQRTP